MPSDTETGRVSLYFAISCVFYKHIVKHVIIYRAISMPNGADSCVLDNAEMLVSVTKDEINCLHGAFFRRMLWLFRQILGQNW